MPDLVLIVEGHGDVAAFPNLVGKVGAWLGEGIYATRPIRSQGWGSVRKPGGIEKWVALAASRDDCKKVVIVVDLDDGCPVSEANSIQERVEALKTNHGIDIELCFCVREFEAWFLRSLDTFNEALSIENDEVELLISQAHTYRDAKGKLRSIMPDGYSESSDQSELVSKIDCANLFERDRSFRKFVKAVSGLEYDVLAAA